MYARPKTGSSDRIVFAKPYYEWSYITMSLIRHLVLLKIKINNIEISVV